jgi:hypothetical protein
MKKFILLSFLIAITISFYGCPYNSKVAIDEPSIKVNKNYEGVWGFKNGTTKYQVTKLDDYHLKITQLPLASQEADAKGVQDTTIYIAHFSKINDVNFLNLTQITKYNKQGDNGYYLYKFVVKGENEITLTEVTSYIKEKFSTSDKLKKFIESNMNLSFFFGTEETYEREL